MEILMSKTLFFDDCIFGHWFLPGATKTWTQLRPLPNVMLHMSVAICEGSCTSEIWRSAQGRVHLLCPNPAFWDAVLLRHCIHMMHTMYLPTRCADPPRPWPENWVMKIQGVYAILLKWVFVTYIWQTKNDGSKSSLFSGAFVTGATKRLHYKAFDEKMPQI
jgi:hypothetical protein